MEVKGDDIIIIVCDRFFFGSIVLFEIWIFVVEYFFGFDYYVIFGVIVVWNEFDFVDFNFFFYCCEVEEMDLSDGKDGVYDILGYGKFVYVGLQGWWSLFEGIICDNNFVYLFCQNFCDGQWVFDYIFGRVERMSMIFGNECLKKFVVWFKDCFDVICSILNFFLLCYFGLVLCIVYMIS